MSGLYGQGRDALTTNFGHADDLYKNLITSYAPGAKAYGDVSGANGVEGLQRGTDLFKNSGQYGIYGVGLNEGLQALNRTHAAAGNLSSGNADTDAIKFAQDQASKAYGQFASGLQPYFTGQGAATMGAANVDMGLGTGLNQSFQGQGGAANTTATTIGNNNAGAEMNNYKVGANLWNGLLDGASAVANAAGGGGTGYGGGKGLFSVFK